MLIFTLHVSRHPQSGAWTATGMARVQELLLTGETIKFETMLDFVSALNDAGVPYDRYRRAVDNVHWGVGDTFIEISEEESIKLGVVTLKIP